MVSRKNVEMYQVSVVVSPVTKDFTSLDLKLERVFTMAPGLECNHYVNVSKQSKVMFKMNTVIVTGYKKVLRKVDQIMEMCTLIRHYLSS